jgi:DNA-binding CsgD family transcriptional regulator
MQAALVWSTLSIWPKVRYLACGVRSPLSVREAQCLRLAFEGLTAHETAEVLGCGDRTVNFHLSNAMAKLDAHNKIEAIQKACWLGVL